MNYENMTVEELRAEMSKITTQLRKMQVEVDTKESLERNIAGFTVKDVAVRYGDVEGYGEAMWFSFLLRKV
jgi:hypothetical protein